MKICSSSVFYPTPNPVLADLFSMPVIGKTISTTHSESTSPWTPSTQSEKEESKLDFIDVETTRLATDISKTLNFFVHTFLTSVTQEKSYRWFPHPWTQMNLTRAIRLSYMASMAYMNICSCKIMDKRNFRHMCRLLFPNTKVINRNLAVLSKSLNVPSSKLNIVPAGKGLVAGSLSFNDEMNALINVSSFLPGAYFIPARPVLMENINIGTPNGLIICDKETTFQVILGHPKASQILDNFIVIHGKATNKLLPEATARDFIKKLGEVYKENQKKKLKVYLLTNMDPQSIIITGNYLMSLHSVCDVSWLSHKLWVNRCSLKLAKRKLMKLTDVERREGKLHAKRWGKMTTTPDKSGLAPMVTTLNEMIQSDEKFELSAVQTAQQVDDEGVYLGLFQHVVKLLKF